jgi:DNA replication protein DnaC
MALNDNIENICKELELPMFHEHHHELSNRAAKEGWKYSEYLLEVLKLEANNRAVRSRATLTKMAGFPTIKTLEQFDFDFTIGVNRRQIEELSKI